MAMRSLLFVPGDSARKLDKALDAGADALIIDLEDAVAPASKPAARQMAREFLDRVRSLPDRPRLVVRINAIASGLADQDLDDVMAGAPDAIMLPKAVGGVAIQHLGAKLAVHEAECGLGDGTTAIIALAAETALGVLALGTIPGVSRRLQGLTWGAEDLAAEIGAEANRDRGGAYTEPYRLARAMTLMTAAAAEVDAIDTVFTAYRDLEGLARDCETGRRDGFVAKMAIHPAQVPVINASFTPAPEAVRAAREVVALFAATPGAGVVGHRGAMLDRPHLRRAERLLARAGVAGSGPGR